MTIEAEGCLRAEVAVVVPTAQRTLIAPAPTLGGTVIALNSVAGLSPGQLLAIGPPNGEERARVHHLGPGPQQVTLTGGLGRPHGIGDHVVADDWTPVTSVPYICGVRPSSSGAALFGAIRSRMRSPPFPEPRSR